VTVGAIEPICLNQDAVGTKPSSVIPKRSTSVDVEECRAGTSEMFSNIRLVASGVNGDSNLGHRVFAGPSGA
jgi:hypothetical protein